MDINLKKIVALNIHLSKELSNLKKELRQTKVSLSTVAQKLKEKSSANTKLDEEIAKLECTIKRLEEERFTDNLIDLNKSGNFFNFT